MANTNTKILEQDLEAKLRAMYAGLVLFQGNQETFPSIYNRLRSIDTADMVGDTKAIIDDLISAKNNDSKGTTGERLRKLEANQGKVNQQDAKVEGTYNELFNYDADGDIIKHTATGEQSFETAYTYSTISGEKVMSGSTTSLKNGNGQKVSVTKTYSYNSNLDITGITTKTTIDDIAPGNVTALSFLAVNGNSNLLNVSFKMPLDKDFVGINIYVKDSNGNTIKYYPKVTATTYSIDIPSDGSIITILFKTFDDSNNETKDAAAILYRTQLNDLSTGTFIEAKGVVTKESKISEVMPSLKV